MSQQCFHVILTRHTWSRFYQFYNISKISRNLTWKFRPVHSTCALMSSSTHQTREETPRYRPQSRIRLLNWLYDDLFKGRLKMNAFFLYAGIVKQVNYVEFFKMAQLDDTFNSWFLVTELHVWMLLARLRAEGKDGRAASKSLVAALWDDSNSRAKALSPGDTSTSKKQINELAQEFRASLLIYDEGLLSSDTVLVSALWFRLLSKSCDDPRILELLTAYVRHQMNNLENTPAEDMFVRASINWIPLPTGLIPGERIN